MNRKTLVKIILLLYAAVAVTVGGLYLADSLPKHDEADENVGGHGNNTEKMDNEEQYGIRRIEEDENQGVEDIRLAQKKKTDGDGVFEDNRKDTAESSEEVLDDKEEGNNADNEPELTAETVASETAADAETESSDTAADAETESSDTAADAETESSETAADAETEPSETAADAETESSDTAAEAETEPSETAADAETESSDTDDEKPEEVKEDGSDGQAKFVANVRTSLNVRSGPSLDSEIIGELSAGEYGYILEEGKEFSLITCGDISGYVSSEYIMTGEAAEKLIGASSENTSGVRVLVISDCYARKGPGTSYDIVTTVWHGMEYPSASENDEKSGWTAIILEDGGKAYISSSYCKIKD